VSDTPEALFADMQRFEESWPGSGAPPTEQEFGDRVRALGARDLLLHLFRAHSGSGLKFWLSTLRFLWQDLPYRTWVEILEEIADDPGSVYDFLWFASETLGLDIHRIPAFHPGVRRALASETFRDGGPHPITARLRERGGDDFDYEGMWDRLAAEGAPMRVVPPGEPDQHVIEV
jgi:hypothetical protein